METTASGIILSTATKEKPVVSEVVAVGPGGVVDGNEVKMVVKPGDKVVVAKYAGTEVKVEDVEYSICLLYTSQRAVQLAEVCP